VRNKFEKRIAQQLEKARVCFKYETRRIPYVISGHYIPDFEIQTPTGCILVECKGYFRPEHKRKMAAVKRQHPELDIRILFYAANKQSIKWAEKNGFKYAFETVPKEWLDGF
jgi:predicted nuclease of restriction endonuclease-like RecB superfamily